MSNLNVILPSFDEVERNGIVIDEIQMQVNGHLEKHIIYEFAGRYYKIVTDMFSDMSCMVYIGETLSEV